MLLKTKGVKVARVEQTERMLPKLLVEFDKEQAETARTQELLKRAYMLQFANLKDIEG